MTVHTDHPTTPQPAYGGDWPAYEPQGYESQAPAPTQPAYGAGEPPQIPASPAEPAPRGRRRAAGAALLLAACLASGATGAGITLLADDADPVAAPAATLTRGTVTPAAAATGTAQSAAAIVAPSVVTIAVTGTTPGAGPFGQSQPRTTSGTGSGIVLRADGHIVTNNHVIAAATGGGTVSVTFSDGTTTPARIIGTDPTSDLAVLKVDGRDDLTPAAFADSDQLAVGQPVLAVGAPLGLSNTVTEGIVSTLGRPVRTGEQGASAQSVIDAVQTDAAINPGNSGGALVDLAGQVVGVNTAIATAGTSGNIGVGFAIPSNDVTEVAEELIADGEASHPQIGISVGDAAGDADGTPGRGAQVQQVTAGGPAAEAGLRAGDIITKIGDRVVTDADSLIVAVRDHDPGDVVPVTYLRGGRTATTEATLVEAPAS